MYPVPDYLTYYYRNNQELFSSICGYKDKPAMEILSSDEQWRGDGTYLQCRKKHEQYLHREFIRRGGMPVVKHPVYMILGESPESIHSLNKDYPNKITVPIYIFKKKDISFTYPDSMYEVPKDDLTRLHLERNEEPDIYLLDELEWIIKTYKVFEINNHYIEAQIWNLIPLYNYKKTIVLEEKHE